MTADGAARRGGASNAQPRRGPARRLGRGGRGAAAESGPARRKLVQAPPVSCGIVVLRDAPRGGGGGGGGGGGREFLMLRRKNLLAYPKGALSRGSSAKEELAVALGHLRTKTGLREDQISVMGGFRFEETFVPRGPDAAVGAVQPERTIILLAATLTDAAAEPRSDDPERELEWVPWSPPHRIHRSVDASLERLAAYLGGDKSAGFTKTKTAPAAPREPPVARAAGKLGGTNGAADDAGAAGAGANAASADELYARGMAAYDRSFGAQKASAAAGTLSRARSLFGQAAERGHLKARVQFARLLQETDARRAFELFGEGARAGDAASMFWESLCRKYGVGVARNEAAADAGFQSASALLEVAARGGDRDAQFLLAETYFNGHGVPTNHLAGIHWYRESARGLAEARHWFARLPVVFPEYADIARARGPGPRASNQ